MKAYIFAARAAGNTFATTVRRRLLKVIFAAQPVTEKSLVFTSFAACRLPPGPAAPGPRPAPIALFQPAMPATPPSPAQQGTTKCQGSEQNGQENLKIFFLRKVTTNCKIQCPSERGSCCAEIGRRGEREEKRQETGEEVREEKRRGHWDH